MKDKYDKHFYDNEKKYHKKNKIKIRVMIKKFYLQMIKKAGYKNYKLVRNSNLRSICSGLSTINDYWQDYIINEIINKTNKSSMTALYIITLTDYLLKSQQKIVDVTMDSFVKSGLIKDIKFNIDEKYFELKTLDNKKIKFMPAHNSYQSALTCKKKCHSVTQYIIQKSDNPAKIFGVTAVFKDYGGYPYYHSFIVIDDIVYDYAQNIIMSFENYKKLFDCKIIMMANGKEILNNIESLKLRDPEFKKSKNVELINYAMYKQMRKMRKYS